MLIRIVIFLIVLTELSLPLAAQWAQRATAGIPRTADGKPNLTEPAPRAVDGKPDLSGIWAGRSSLADYKSDYGKPWVQALVQRRAENYGKDNPAFQCLPHGPGYSTAQGSSKQIVQTPAMILLLNDDLTYRRIFIDGRLLETDPFPSWMGYSVGRWEGDTLVVESNGFSDRTWLDELHPHTEALHMTERYRRPDFGHLDLEVTFEDVGTYTKPWTTRVGAVFTADTEMLETYCDHSQSQNRPENWVGKASDEEKTAVAVAPEVLSKYAGVYKGFWGQRPRLVEATFIGGRLYVAVDGKEQLPLIPQSATLFTAGGYSYTFIRDTDGPATHVVESHVTGDYKYQRQK
jgi:hypothetical protein